MNSNSIPNSPPGAKPVAIDIDLVSQFQALEFRHRELEERYSQLQARFEHMQQATQDALWDWDLITNRGWYSQGLKILFGYDPEQLGDGVAFWFKNIHPSDEPRVSKDIHDAIDSGGQHWSAQYRFKKSDGNYTWIFDRGFVIRDQSGKAIRMVGSMQDVSKEISAKQALHESEERVRLAVESAELGIWDFDPRLGVLKWDKRCKEFFGLSENAFVDYNVFIKGLHPDDRERVHEINQSALAGKSGGHYDTEYRTIGIEDGKLRWIRAKGQSYFDQHGVSHRYAGTVIDITDQKLREQELREQEERFRLLATSIPQIVWTTSADGVVDYITDKWEAYTGQKPDYTTGLFRSMVHEDDLPQMMEQWKECLKEGKELLSEYRLKNARTNQYRWFKVTTAPLKDASGNITKWIGSATDIHDQKTIEKNLEERVADRTKELRMLNVMLEKSNEELEQYAYVASHDLQEPLRKIQFYSSNIVERHHDELTSNIKTYIEKIDLSAGRMSHLIKDLLTFSKLSHLSPFVKVNLNDVVKEVLSDFELVIKQKEITIHLAQLPTIHAIPVQMRQLFFNLIGNAIKFSKPDKPNVIRITCREMVNAETAKYPMLLPAAHHYQIVCADEGIGFDSEFNEQIFTIFQRLNDKKTFDGHGIGLALCRKIAGNHKGLIFSKGTPGVGAELTVILPDNPGQN